MAKLLKSLLLLVFFLPTAFLPQSKAIPPMVLDVGNIHMKMDSQMGDGGLQSQFSWNLVGMNRDKTEIFYWPRDEWQSNMLYQIFNPVSLGDSGIIDQNGVKRLLYLNGDALTNSGKTVWAQETRRYRPPHVTVDGKVMTSPYVWKVDPTLKSDIKLEFEDILPQFGIRSHVEIFGFSSTYFSDFFIWKATHKFTGEITTPDDTAKYSKRIPDQTIKFWWPIAFTFGPTKSGERAVNGGFDFEGNDDLDNWFKKKSELVTSGSRDSLYVAYYQDSNNSRMNLTPYANGSIDDTGDPDRTNGHLYSTQLPGYTLLYADKSNVEKTDDPKQPYSMPHAGIDNDFWGRRDLGLKLTYRGDDSRGRFPGQPATKEKGPMRFITVGPYELTKDSKTGRYDSLTFVYAVGAGSIGWKAADSVGKLWFKGQINDSEKDAWILKGKDSLWKAMDMANWVWNRISKKQTIPSPPPPPDVDITSGKGSITIRWSYPDPSYFKDAETCVDDWQAWRIYRKKGGPLVNDPLDQRNGERWQMIFETNDRNTLSFVDTTAGAGTEYYYAVTALDNGTQNSSGLLTGVRLESSRFVNMSTALAYITGINDKDNITNYSYSLGQNYPNPFNPVTAITYTIPKESHVELVVYDMLGRTAATIVDKEQAAGEYKVQFDGSSLPSGIYIYSIHTSEFRASRKLLLLK